MRTRVIASSAPNGSSMRSSEGRVTIARANAARCCIPPDSSLREGVAELRQADGRQDGVGLGVEFRIVPLVGTRGSLCSGAKRTFFLVVSQGNSIGLWKSMPRSGPARWTSRPPTVTEP